MEVTIIVPTFRRHQHVQKLWSNLQECLPANLSLEILFIVNGHDAKTIRYLQGLNAMTVLQCKQNTPAFARNLGIAKAKGEWLLFLDDDVQLPPQYFSRALKTLAQWRPEVLGGPEIASPESNDLQQAYAFCQSHPLITGHTHHRHHRKGILKAADESQLTLCHLWIKGEIFEQGFRFPPHYGRNEENILLHQLQRAGKKILYDPELYVHHFKKDTPGKIIAATLASGRGRMRSFLEYPQSFHPLFLAPAFLVLNILLLPFFPWPLALYGLLCLLVGGQCLWQKRSLPIALRALFLTPVIHLSYGMGMLLLNFRRRP